MHEENADNTPDLSPDAEQSYLLHEPRDIRRVLQALVDGRSLISATVSPGGLSCPTAILALEEDGLLIDGHHQEAINQRISAAHHLLCTSQLEQIRIQFRLQQLVRIQEDGYTAFRAPHPEKVLELQRRTLYRITVPPGQPLMCTLQVAKAGGGSGPVELRVQDISGGGIALLVPDELAGLFRPHAEFADCLLQLPDAAPIPVRLAVCHVHARQVRHGTQLQAGCRFLGLPRQAENLVQHYIFRIDRQRTARERRGA